MQQQLRTLGSYRDLDKQQAPSMVAQVDASRDSSSKPTPRVSLDLRQDVRRRNLGASGGPSLHSGRSAGRNQGGGDRPARVEDVVMQDNRVVRLAHKPKTPYPELSDDMKQLLRVIYNITNEAEYDKWEKRWCPICAQDGISDHWLSRCVRLWASTEAGRNVLGNVKATKQVARALENLKTTTRKVTVVDVIDAIYAGYTPDEEQEPLPTCVGMMINQVSDYCGVCEDDPISEVYAVVEEIERFLPQCATLFVRQHDHAAGTETPQ